MLPLAPGTQARPGATGGGTIKQQGRPCMASLSHAPIRRIGDGVPVAEPAGRAVGGLLLD